MALAVAIKVRLTAQIERRCLIEILMKVVAIGALWILPFWQCDATIRVELSHTATSLGIYEGEKVTLAVRVHPVVPAPLDF